jgi:hypothetical protein
MLQEDDGSDSAEEDLDEMGESGGNLPIDRRSHFTNYSMSSAVIRRDNGLRLIDDHFEQLYEEYGEGKIGGECGDGDEDGGMGVSHLMEPDTDRLQPLVENSRADRRRYFVEVFLLYYA